MSTMDTVTEPIFIPVKEEHSEYEDEAGEWEEDSEMITVKVEPNDTEHSALQDSGSSENDTIADPTHLLENRNPGHFYIAKLSQKLNSKLNKVLSPQNDNISKEATPNYFNFIAENLIGGEGLKCSWCPATATYVEELKEHKLVCTLNPSKRGLLGQSNPIDGDGVERRYVCDVCGRRFARNGFLKRHYVQHSSVDPFTCIVCKANFKSAKCLKDHRIIHLKHLPYICPKCNRGFPNREALKEHARVHFKDMPFSCRFCGKPFMQAKNLNSHLKIHSGQTIYPCDECERSFDTADERTAHKTQHNLLMPYKCELCKQSFPTTRLRQRHSAVHDLENPWKCEHCKKRFTHETSYRAHLKDSQCNRPLVCSQCEELANSVTCDDNEEFMCEDCDLPFLHKQCLVNHVRSHPKTGNVSCEHCGKEFPYVSAYHRHMLIHAEQRPFKCTECSRCFFTRTNLKEHMHNHWRDRPFACKVCAEEVSFNNMMTHLMSHAGRKTVLNETGNTRKDAEASERKSVWKESGNKKSDAKVKRRKTVLNETGNTPRDVEARGRSEEPRRSLRATKSCNYSEGTSDELEDEDTDFFSGSDFENND